MKKLMFIFNPCAGKGKICKMLSDVVIIFAAEGYDVTVVPTMAKGDCEKKILDYGALYDRIVVAGGDGMLHELVNGIGGVMREVQTGYIPTGTVNDFAAANRIPKDIRKAAEIAVCDNIVKRDIGIFQNECFAYTAAFGLVTNVAYSTEQKAKNEFVRLAYLAEALKNFDYPHFEEASKDMTIITDAGVIEGQFIFGAVTNSISLGGMKNFTDDKVVLNDGILEGIFIQRPQTLMELEQMKKGLAVSDFSAPCIRQVRSAQYIINSEKMSWTLDGEDGGMHDSVKIGVISDKFNIALHSR